MDVLDKLVAAHNTSVASKAIRPINVKTSNNYALWQRLCSTYPKIQKKGNV
jgi:hypothetical protein